jgi:hypothetical protein
LFIQCAENPSELCGIAFRLFYNFPEAEEINEQDEPSSYVGFWTFFDLAI